MSDWGRLQITLCAAAGLVFTSGIAAAQPAAWPASDGSPSRARTAAGPARLTVPVDRWITSVGGRPEAGQILADDLDGDGILDLVAIQGGRLEAFGADGGRRWRTAPLSGQRIEGLFDFDLDGRQELLLTSAGALHLLDSLSGELLWSSPDEPLTHIGRVMVRDLDGDGYPELYVADQACGAGGRGPGLTFDFSAGVLAPRQRAVTDDEARTYICGTYQTYADLDGDGALELIVPDDVRVQAFDPLTGARRFEGADLGALPFALLPHAVADVDGDGDDELVGFLNNDPAPEFDGRRGVILLDLVDGQIAPRWETGFPAEDALPRASGVVVTGGPGGATAILASHWSAAEDRWSILRFDAATGAAEAVLTDHRLIGAADLDGDGAPELITRAGDPQAPAQFGTVTVYGSDLAPRFSLERARVELLTPSPRRTDRTPDGRRIFTIARAAGGAALVLSRDGDDDHLVDTIESLGADGALLGSVAVIGRPGGFTVSDEALVEPAAPARGLGVWALADGHVGAWRADLTLTNGVDGQPAPRAPGGTPQVIAADTVGDDVPRPVVVSSDGRVVAFESTGVERWAAALNASGGTLEAGQLVAGGATEIVVDDQRDSGELAYVALDGATGEILWRHALPADAYRANPPALVVDLDDDGAAEVLRYDARRADDVRVITALDGATGEIRWVAEIPATVLALTGRLSAQIVDGVLQVLFPDALHVYAIDGDGQVSPGVESNQTGGLIRPTGAEPPFIRAGGARPLLALGADRATAWQAPALAANSAWVGRSAVAVGGSEIWISPAVGAPIERLRLADGASVGQVGLANGGTLPPPYEGAEDVRALTAVPDLLDDGAVGVAVSTSAGWLYALGVDGSVGWARSFNTALSDVAWADVDDDGEVEALVGLGDGRLIMMDQAEVDPPTSVWDNDGDAPAGSDVADLDVSFAQDMLGADWTAVPGADAYEIRLLGANDSEIRPWQLVGEATFFRFEGLALVPGSTYFAEVRALIRQANGTLSRSTPTRSDGVLIADDTAPTVTITADPEVVPFGGARRVDLSVEAADDDRLAALRVEIYASGEEALIRRVLIRPLAGASFSGDAVWGLDDLDGEPVPPGLYRARASVSDRADNQAQDEVQVVICDEALTVDPRCEAVTPDMGVEDMGLADMGVADMGVADMDVDMEPTDFGAAAADMEITPDGDPIGAEPSESIKGSDGCDCQTSQRGPASLLWLLALVGLRRRA